MNLEKVQKILRGQEAINDYGMIAIQWRREATIITRQGYCVVNCSSSHLRRYRVDYIENGEFHSTKLITRAKAKALIEIKFKGGKKLLNGYNIATIINNLATNGYTGLYIYNLLKRGKKPKRDRVKYMEIAEKRHALTSYDSTDKSSLTDYEVRELRRQANLSI